MDYGRFSRMGKNKKSLTGFGWLWNKIKEVIFCKKKDEENGVWNEDWVKEKFD